MVEQIDARTWRYKIWFLDTAVVGFRPSEQDARAAEKADLKTARLFGRIREEESEPST